MATDMMTAPAEQTAKAEKFAASIPYPVKKTNLPGVYAMTQMPSGADLASAAPTTLLRHGIPFRRPDAQDRPAVQAAWSSVFERETPFQLIVPEFEITPGRRHLHRRQQTTQDTVQAVSGNWAGAVVDSTSGPWVSAAGQFTIPTVSKPSEPAVVNNGWQCVAWVGIDGYSDATPSNDVLQIGVEQTVDSTGNTTCTAWFEWWVQSATVNGGVNSISQNKVVLGDTTPMSPSLAGVGGQLYLAWRGDGNEHMNVIVSHDGGRSFAEKLVTVDTSDTSPAICEMNGKLYLAWKGSGNDNLNVAQVTLDGNFAPTGLTNKVILGDTSGSTPALCSLNGMLYLSWRGDGNDQICIMRSPDGITWTNQYVSNQTTPVSPALGVCNGQLFAAWRGDGNDQLNVASIALDASKAPTGINSVTTLTITAPQAPALAGLNGFLYLSFMGENGDELYVFVSEDEGASFPVGYSSPESTPSGPAMAAVNAQMMLSWRGEDNDQLNVAPILSNFSTYPYINQANITNFPVSPGDSVTASVTYNGSTSGVVQLANHATGLAFSLTVLPPPGANFNGKCVEWVMETPQINGTLSALPAFTPLVFTHALGCASRAKAVANPNSSVTPEVVNSAGKTMTGVTTGSDTLTVTFIG